MTAPVAPTSQGSGSHRWPALLALLLGLLPLVLRPAIPLDETRYVQVLRELLAGDPLLLHLDGQLYLHKTPLLFWLATPLVWLGLSPELALRLLPGPCTALTVLLVGRAGRRLGLPGAGWIQAAMLLPLFLSQVLLFDALLAASVWLFLVARLERRAGLAALGSALALFAKGPVALLFLLPLGWALDPARLAARGAPGEPLPPLGRRLGHLGLWMLPGIAALGAWAGAVVLRGGRGTIDELTRQVAGRTVDSYAHAQPLWFYAAVLPLVTLPFAPALLRRARTIASAPGLPLGRATLVCVLALTAVSAKQPQYLMPLCPALALLAARALTGSERPGAVVRGLAALLPLALGLYLGAVAVAPHLAEGSLERYGPYGEALLASPVWRALLVGGALGALAAAAVALRARTLRTVAAAHALGLVLALAPVHHAFGRLVIPRDFERLLLATTDRPLAIFGNVQAGLYNYLSGRVPLDHVDEPEGTRAWSLAHPGGLVISEEQHLERLAGLPLEVRGSDLVRGTRSFVFVARPDAQLDPAPLRAAPIGVPDQPLEMSTPGPSNSPR